MSTMSIHPVIEDNPVDDSLGPVSDMLSAVEVDAQSTPMTPGVQVDMSSTNPSMTMPDLPTV